MANNNKKATLKSIELENFKGELKKVLYSIDELENLYENEYDYMQDIFVYYIVVIDNKEYALTHNQYIDSQDIELEDGTITNI